MTTTTTPAPKLSLALALPTPATIEKARAEAAAAAAPPPVEPEVDAFEQAIEASDKLLAAHDFQGALVWNATKALFKKLRGEELAPLASNVDALVQEYEDEETLADHAEEYLKVSAQFTLKLLVAAQLVDAKGAWLGSPELKVDFDAFEKATAEFHAHVLETRVVETTEDIAQAVAAAAPALAAAAAGTPEPKPASPDVPTEPSGEPAPDDGSEEPDLGDDDDGGEADLGEDD